MQYVVLCTTTTTTQKIEQKRGQSATNAIASQTTKLIKTASPHVFETMVGEHPVTFLLACASTTLSIKMDAMLSGDTVMTLIKTSSQPQASSPMAKITTREIVTNNL